MTPLYARALGGDFDALPPALRRFHGGAGVWRGVAHLTRGGAIARRAARLAGYPDADGPVPLTLTIAPDGAAETWHRDFDGRIVASRQRLAGPGLIAERLGPGTVVMRPRIGDRALHMDVTGLRSVPLPLPPILSGGGTETAEGAAIRFDVAARLPGLGLLLRYEGTLTLSA